MNPHDMPPAGERMLFLDVETTGLDANLHQLVEVAWVLREPDGTEFEDEMVCEHTLDGADEDALAINGYHERIAPRPRTPNEVVAARLAEALEGAAVVGANPAFDMDFIVPFLRANGMSGSHHHRLQDVSSLCAPFTTGRGRKLAGLAACAQALQVSYDATAHHGALYDARLALAVYDAYWDRVEQLLAAA